MDNNELLKILSPGNWVVLRRGVVQEINSSGFEVIFSEPAIFIRSIMGKSYYYPRKGLFHKDRTWDAVDAPLVYSDHTEVTMRGAYYYSQDIISVFTSNPKENPNAKNVFISNPDKYTHKDA